MHFRSFPVARYVLIFTLMVSLTSCAHKPKAVEEPPPGTFLEDIYTTPNPKTDLETFDTAMPPHLQYLDTLIKPSTEDVKLFTRVSGAYYGYAHCFVEDRDRKEAAALYLKGRDYALNELRYYRIFDTAFTYKQSIEAFRQALIDSFSKANVPLVYWAAMNWTGWITVNLNKPEAVADIPRAIAMLEYVDSYDQSYGNGSVHAALGTLCAARSKAKGGDPDRAREEFEKAFSASFSSTLTYQVSFAKYYSYQARNRELFQKTLESVAEKPENFSPDMNFVNEVARKKARALLKNIDRYFKKPQPKPAAAGAQPADPGKPPQEGAPQAQEPAVQKTEPPAQPQESAPQPQQATGQAQETPAQPQEQVQPVQEAPAQPREEVRPPQEGAPQNPDTSAQPREEVSPAQETPAQPQESAPQPQQAAGQAHEPPAQPQEKAAQAEEGAKLPREENPAQPQDAVKETQDTAAQAQ